MANRKEREAERHKMVREQIEARGIDDAVVLDAMRKVPRHIFVPPEQRDESYEDHPINIGYSQTISQPYIVALMTSLCDIDKHSRVLDVGAGCGYQSAILAEIASEVFAIEIVCSLAETAKKNLDKLGYRNVILKCGDGYSGWKRAAPFDAIIVAAAPSKIPQPLIDQLAEGGKMIIPVGEYQQYLKRLTKVNGKIKEENLLAVRFVPMTGEINRQQSAGKAKKFRYFG